MDENLDKLKRQWQQLSVRVANLESLNRKLMEDVSHKKIETLQDRIASRIARLSIAGFIMPFLAPLIKYELGLDWWIAIVYGLFGLFDAALSLWLARFIREKRLVDLSVAEAVKRAMKFQKYKSNIRVFGIIIAMFIILTIGISIPPGPERIPIFVGGGLGFLGGLIFSIHRYIVDARIMRQIIKSLSSED